MNPKIKIILAQSQVLFRKSLVAFLKLKPEFEIVAEVSSGREVVDLLKQKHANVVILDTEMQVLEGKSTMEVLKLRFPNVKIIILSINGDIAQMHDFMASGASSYLCKSCDEETLVKAIRQVNSEGYFLDNLGSKELLNSIIKGRSKSTVNADVSFNERETEVLVKICDGMSNKQIAAYLNLSPSTIDFHRTKIYSKVNCSKVLDLYKFALKRGLVSTP